MRVMLTYFKAHGGGPKNLGGKFYSDGEYELTCHPDRYFGVFEEVARMRDERRLPGLVTGHGDYHVLITTDPESVPHLLVAPSFVNPESSDEHDEEDRKTTDERSRRKDPRWFELFKAALGGLCADTNMETGISGAAARIADRAYDEIDETSC